jgi:magnesium transporter
MRFVQIRRRSKKSGLPPGTLIHVGEERAEPVHITTMAYDEQRVDEQEVADIADCLALAAKPGVTWVNVDGVHEVEVVQQLGDCLFVEPLILEDILNTDQRPKVEDFEDYVFLVARMLRYDGDDGGLQVEQISLLLGPNYVISFQEKPGDVFDPVRARIRGARGRIRRMGADYLAYALVDALVDSYFLALERIGERIETIQDKLITDPRPETLRAIHDLKRDLIFLRKSVWPLREVTGTLERGETSLVGESVLIYLRDVYGHVIQVMDTVETFRDMINGMLDIYLSSISNRMNEVMKVLTIIATIFIPLTLITGVYGMNFQHMPELAWPLGYPLVWVVMLAIAGAMLLYFRRKKWL